MSAGTHSAWFTPLEQRKIIGRHVDICLAAIAEGRPIAAVKAIGYLEGFVWAVEGSVLQLAITARCNLQERTLQAEIREGMAARRREAEGLVQVALGIPAELLSESGPDDS